MRTGTSTDRAWRTLNRVNGQKFVPGDRILLRRGGTWEGQLSPAGSGDEMQPIQIGAYGAGHSPIIHGPGTNGSAAVSLKDQSYWEIENIEVTNQQPAGGSNVLRGIWISESSGDVLKHHIYIRNCFVHNVDSVGYGEPHYAKLSGGIILTVNVEDALVENCHVSDVAVEGIRNNSPITTSRVVIRNNLVENVYGDGIVLHGSSGGSVIERNTVRRVCISDKANFAAVWTYSSHDTLIQFNEVYATVAGGPNDGEAFDADIDTDGDIFQYNWTHDNPRGFMLFMASAKNIIVRYNISQNDGSGVARQGGHRLFYQDGKSGSLSNQIYNNTFYTGLLDTMFFQGHTVFFKNNIVYSTGRIEKLSNMAFSPDGQFENNIFFAKAPVPIKELSDFVRKNLQMNPKLVKPGSGRSGPAFGKSGFPTSPRGYQLHHGSPAAHQGVMVKDNGGFDYFGRRLAASTASIGAAETD